MKRPPIPVAIAITVVLLLVITLTACGSQKPSIMSPTSTIEGQTYGEWLAKWWTYALTIPAAENPLNGGENCVLHRIGNVELLIANSTLDVPINCEVPAGTKLFLEVLGAECSTLEEAPFYGGNEVELQTCVQSYIPQDLEASIDGIAIKNLEKYIVTSPLYEFTEPEDNILGVPTGTTGQSVGIGAYLMITSLSTGEHTIHVHGVYPDPEYTADKNINLTVTP